MDERIAKLIKNLDCTYEEALAIIASDKEIDQGKAVDFDLTPEQAQVAKKYTGTGTKATHTKSERKRKENPTKGAIIALLAEVLTENGYENIQITNAERQIAFEVGVNHYELTLVQKRK